MSNYNLSPVEQDDCDAVKGCDTIVINTPAQPARNLAECIAWIEDNIDPALRRKVEVMDKRGKNGLETLHMGLAADLREHCALWDAGTHEVVEDIKRLQAAGVRSAVFDMFTLDFDLDWRSQSGTIYSVYHPDNTSGVILDYYQELINGNIGLSLIERKKNG